MRHTWHQGPSLGLALAVADGYHSVSAGGAHLLWATATLEACPLRWAITKSFSLAPCVPFEGGVLDVSGANVPAPTSSPRPWLTLGALARAVLELGNRFFLEARGGLAFPLIRDTFFFLPQTNVYGPPAVVGWGGIAAGFTFP